VDQLVKLSNQFSFKDFEYVTDRLYYYGKDTQINFSIVKQIFRDVSVHSKIQSNAIDITKWSDIGGYQNVKVNFIFDDRNC
jgi:hypothetical protein